MFLMQNKSDCSLELHMSKDALYCSNIIFVTSLLSQIRCCAVLSLDYSGAKGFRLLTGPQMDKKLKDSKKALNY